jgi:MoaA/NifB/PqqE/SkfB family radical SAM enzyme
VTVSLDHWEEGKHDSVRKCRGAYKIALRAIETFLELGGIHVSVSAVLSKGPSKKISPSRTGKGSKME